MVPAHNEAGNIERLVEAVFEALAGTEFSCELVLVENNSTHWTSAIADRFAETYEDIVIVHRTDCPGLGNALKAVLA